MGGQHAALDGKGPAKASPGPGARLTTLRTQAATRPLAVGIRESIPSLRVPTLMRTPAVGHADDAFERQADAVADSVVKGGRSQPVSSSSASNQPCTDCPSPAGVAAGGATIEELPEDDLRPIGGSASLRRRPMAGSTMPDDESVGRAVRTIETGGTPLPSSLGADVGAALGNDFGHVRIHADDRAGRAAQAIGARAFTVGDRIAFAPGEYRPGTSAGRWLVAHELTHVAQQGRARPAASPSEGHAKPAAAPAAAVQRQEAPADPAAPVALLTEPQITAAITYNAARFGDPFTIATIRELIGIAKYPAVSDRDLALGIAAWQDSHPPLTVDGKIGAGTTKTFTEALDAAGNASLRDQVRVDHTVSASAVAPATRNVPTPAAHGVFTLNASFNTTLRRGWIIQELRNTWNEVVCGGVANPNVPTLHYYEAWWVTDAGAVRLPTSLGTPPTSVALGATHDVWQRGLARGTRGDFTMNSRLYTTLTLPAGFAIPAVADAGDLPSAAALPNTDLLGTVQGTRHAQAHWNGCPGVPNFHTA